MNANPNVIELLFMPEDCVRVNTPFFEKLQDSRSLFVTGQAFESHVGYARAQIKKAKGQNKWVNNPKPKKRPRREDFCWFIDSETTLLEGMPMRPKPVSETSVNLSHCHAAALEHAPGMYRIYHYGSEAKGVFRGGKVVCESILMGDENRRLIGLLSDNESAYARAVRDHRSYWDWVDNRNGKRWETQEAGLMDYDAKNMQHTFRLLLSGEAILRTGKPIVRFNGAVRKFLRDIRNGKFEYEELSEQVEERVHVMEGLSKRCILSKEVDKPKVEKLLKEITRDWEEVNRI